METVIHWRPRSPYGWMVHSGIVVAIILLMSLASPEGGYHWMPLFIPAALPLWSKQVLQPDVWVLSHGVLAVQSGGGLPRFIPLAVVELQRADRAWYLRWQEGPRRRSVRLPYDERFAPALEEAVRRAHAERDEPARGAALPRTAHEAARTVALSIPHLVRSKVALPVTYGLLAFIIPLFAAAVWTGSPALLLPLAALPYALYRLQEVYRLVLTPEGLWFSKPDEEPVLAPLEAVRYEPGLHHVTVWADHPGIPSVELLESISSDLMRRIRTVVREREARALAQEAGLPEQAEPLRCSLCGRPIPGLTAGGGRASGGNRPGGGARGGKPPVLICDRCGGRTRYEAQETGHGLTGKEPKPMG